MDADLRGLVLFYYRELHAWKDIADVMDNWYRLDGTSAEAAYGHGAALLDFGQWKESLAIVQEAMKRHPTDMGLRQIAAEALIAANKPHEAKELLVEILDAEALQPEVMLDYSLALLAGGEQKEFIAVLKRFNEVSQLNAESGITDLSYDDVFRMVHQKVTNFQLEPVFVEAVATALIHALRDPWQSYEGQGFASFLEFVLRSFPDMSSPKK